MSVTSGIARNPGRVAGLWYLILVVLGPLRLEYIPDRLFVRGDATATANNIAAHQWLFRAGMAADLVGAVVLVFLTLAFYRLFQGVSRSLAAQVVILGGVMPSLLYFVNIARDAAALMVVRGSDFLAAFDKPQRDALAMLILRLHDQQNVAAEMLWGLWLFPLAILVYRSRFVPRFLGVWLFLAGVGWVIMSFTGLLAPEYQGRLFAIVQPAVIGEIALMLWLVVKGARPAETSGDPRQAGTGVAKP